jgi:hypothetical protein
MATKLPDYIMRADTSVGHRFDGRTLEMLNAFREQFNEVNEAIENLKNAQKVLAGKLEKIFPEGKTNLPKR